MEYLCNTKCSSCGQEGISNSTDFPFDCGVCEECTIEFVSDIKTLTKQRNKLNRQITTLKKVNLNK